MNTTQIHTMTADDVTVEVWSDDQIPDAPMIALDVWFAGKDTDEPVFIPVGVAREVAAAILAATEQ